jgi:putative DNA primase/helicase
LTELNGILNFAMEGYKRLKKNNFEFTEAEKVKEILEEYKLEINPYLDFIRDCITSVPFDRNKKVSTVLLRNVFCMWCIDTNRKKMSEASVRTFMREVRLALKNENIVFGESKSNGELFISGIDFSRKGNDLRNKFKNAQGEKRWNPNAKDL